MPSPMAVRNCQGYLCVFTVHSFWPPHGIGCFLDLPLSLSDLFAAMTLGPQVRRGRVFPSTNPVCVLSRVAVSLVLSEVPNF